MTETVIDEGLCKPNISSSGRRLRSDFGWRWAVVAAFTLSGLIALRAAWTWRLLVFVPAALSAIGFLQAHRMTCVARAAEGTFEHDDMTKTVAPEAEVAASRRAARGIHRDTILVGLLSAAIAAATAWIR